MMNAVWQVLTLLGLVVLSTIWWNGMRTSPSKVDRKAYDFEEMLVGLGSLVWGGFMYTISVYCTLSFYFGVAPVIVFFVGCGVIIVRRRKKHEADLKTAVPPTPVL